MMKNAVGALTAMNDAEELGIENVQNYANAAGADREVPNFFRNEMTGTM